MNIAVAVKVVPDDQDIVVGADRSIDASKAHQIVSEYDLNALEAAAQLADATGAKLVAISASNGAADDLKVKKSILSRGPEELFMVADDGLAMADARTTAAALAKLVGNVEGGVDLVVCGDGSADMYAGQVDVQLASILGVPVVNKATGLSVEDGVLVVERTLDDCVEVVEVPLPAVVSVQPSIALPREILAAGKKPATVADAAASGVSVEGTVAVVDVKAPELADRKRQIFDASKDGDFDEFVRSIVAVAR